MAGLAHHVFFTLHDSSKSAIDTQIAACKKYLQNHEGCTLFAVGARTGDLQREVNDQEFHVSLHVHFESRQAHDAYQVAERHLQFIAENKDHWAAVRVFDSDLADA